MSYVHYKFKNQRGSSVVDFDGPYIPYDELKRDIIRRSLSKSTDFDLKIVDEHTKKEYKDGDQIHKNASVIVSRVPITDKRVHIINNSRFVPQHAQPQHSTASRPEEEDLPQAPQMFNVGPSDKQQILKGKPSPDYECKRCFVRGDHYFQNCPTWNDPNFEDRIAKVPAGVPATDLEEVADHTVKGAMLTADNRWVRLKQRDNPLRATNTGREPPEHLRCRMCRQLLREAVFMPCCNSSFCDSCIRSHLLADSNPRRTCPQCGAPDRSPAELTPDYELRKQVEAFLRGDDITQEQEQQQQQQQQQSIQPPPMQQPLHPGMMPPPGGFPPPNGMVPPHMMMAPGPYGMAPPMMPYGGMPPPHMMMPVMGMMHGMMARPPPNMYPGRMPPPNGHMRPPPMHHGRKLTRAEFEAQQRREQERYRSSSSSRHRDDSRYARDDRHSSSRHRDRDDYDKYDKRDRDSRHERSGKDDRRRRRSPRTDSRDDKDDYSDRGGLTSPDSTRATVASGSPPRDAALVASNSPTVEENESLQRESPLQTGTVLDSSAATSPPHTDEVQSRSSLKGEGTVASDTARLRELEDSAASDAGDSALVNSPPEPVEAHQQQESTAHLNGHANASRSRHADKSRREGRGSTTASRSASRAGSRDRDRDRDGRSSSRSRRSRSKDRESSRKDGKDSRRYRDKDDKRRDRSDKRDRDDRARDGGDKARSKDSRHRSDDKYSKESKRRDKDDKYRDHRDRRDRDDYREHARSSDDRRERSERPDGHRAKTQSSRHDRDHSRSHSSRRDAHRESSRHTSHREGERSLSKHRDDRDRDRRRA
eukprot:TRINITY_DN11795_c1_g3_i13.p1 TRINITY_DN11795_c1_g3~~TRINITY_DN11795_c1_g3_i13.p1  ORF type:complete len:819 (+),score=149.31 TRINITY_DN11795_c1_g3_i13:256-2712(+)